RTSSRRGRRRPDRSWGLEPPLLAGAAPRCPALHSGPPRPPALATLPYRPGCDDALARARCDRCAGEGAFLAQMLAFSATNPTLCEATAGARGRRHRGPIADGSTTPGTCATCSMTSAAWSRKPDIRRTFAARRAPFRNEPGNRKKCAIGVL